MLQVAKILEDLGISYKEIGDNFTIKCPYHDEKHPSFNIKKDIGIWHCFSCQRSGNIFMLLRDLLGVEGVGALEYLKSFAKKGTTDDAITAEVIKDIQVRTYLPVRTTPVILPETLPLEEHPYLIKRGFTSKELREWDMRIVVDKTKKFEPYIGWVMIPIIQEGRLRNYFLRSPYKNRKIFGPYSVKGIFAGLDNAVDLEKPIYIVEGIFDMIFLRRIGVQVIASLTNRLYEDQQKILKRYKRVVLVPDGDLPGLELVLNAESLIYDLELGVCTIPNNKKDTAECTQRELFQTIKSEQSFNNFICNNRRYISWKLNKLHPQT